MWHTQIWEGTVRKNIAQASNLLAVALAKEGKKTSFKMLTYNFFLWQEKEKGEQGELT